MMRFLAAVLLVGRSTAQEWSEEPTCGCVCDGSTAECLSYPGYCADMWGRDLVTGEVTDTCVEDGSGDGCGIVACQSGTPPAAVTTYALMSNGVCATGYLAANTLDECAAAAVALELEDTEPALVAEQPQLPQGCFYKPRTSSLYYNPAGVTNNLSPDMQALCSDAPGCIMNQVPPEGASWGEPRTPPPPSALLHVG